MSQDELLSSGALIVRLLSVARGLEDEGQYNIAKLFRAAACSEGTRATWNRPRLHAGLLDEIDATVEALREAGSYMPIDVLEHGLSIFHGGGMPTVESVPQLWVCRYCGQTMLGTPPDRCPSCRARHLTFQRILPTFYLEDLAPEVIVRTLATNLTDIRSIMRHVPEERGDLGDWPLRAMLRHLLGSEKLLTERVSRTLEEDEPAFTSTAPSAISSDMQTSPALVTLVDELTALRQQTLARLHTLVDTDWKRRGYHPEWGWMTVQQQGSYLVRHEQGHLAELEARAQGEAWGRPT